MSGGVCLDALNPAGRPFEDLAASGADGARLVAFDAAQFFTYTQTLTAAAFDVAIVIARESCADDDFGGWTSFYASYIHPTYWVLGNEMDAYLLPAESPSSWKMTPAEYAAFWHEAAPPILERQPDARLVVGGLVSGQPSYLEEVLPLLDPRPYAVDIHPYGRDATSAADLFGLYRSIPLAAARERLRSYAAVLQAHGLERRLQVLEWNRPAEEIGAYEQMLRQEAGFACWFCWSDGMVAPFGLIDAGGHPKAEYHAFLEVQMAEPNEAIQKTMQEFEQAGGTVGTIYSVTDNAGWQVANTDAGLFVAQDGVPGAQILLDARAKNPFR